MILHRFFLSLLILQNFISPTLADWDQGWDETNISRSQVSNATRGCLAEPKVRSFFNTQTKAGVHAPTKPAAQQAPFTFRSEIFTKKVTWTSPTGTKQTYGVWQRKDIDWNMVRTAGPPKFIGKTNKEAAKAGFSPQLDKDNFINLHHINQNGKGNLVEASTRVHGFGKPGHKSLHSIWGFKKGHPEFPVNRPKFNQDVVSYWKNRCSK